MKLLSMGPLLHSDVGKDSYIILNGNILMAFKKSYHTTPAGIGEQYTATHSKILANVETMTLHAAIDRCKEWYQSL